MSIAAATAIAVAATAGSTCSMRGIGRSHPRDPRPIYLLFREQAQSLTHPWFVQMLSVVLRATCWSADIQWANIPPYVHVNTTISTFRLWNIPLGLERINIPFLDCIIACAFYGVSIDFLLLFSGWACFDDSVFVLFFSCSQKYSFRACWLSFLVELLDRLCCSGGAVDSIVFVSVSSHRWNLFFDYYQVMRFGYLVVSFVLRWVLYRELRYMFRYDCYE